jgi:hypothetical protein
MSRLLVLGLMLTMMTGVSTADRDRDRGRDRRGNRPDVRDNRNRPPERVNRPARRSDRRVINRRPVHLSNGRFVFEGGVTQVYRRPLIRGRYFNVRIRPQLVVESYLPVPGYIWVRGQWIWSGTEWQWNDGYYAPDPQYSNYYDDGSYDYSINIRL